MINSGVYTITHIASGKQYVGSSTNLKKRWQKHTRELCQGIHHNAHLQNAWSKHGPAAFEFAVVERVDRADLISREQAWLDQMSPNRFNISLSAGRPEPRRGPHSEETKAKIRAKRALQVITRESIEKTRAGNLGQKRSPESRAAISAGRLGMRFSATHVESIVRARTGTTISEATRAKMSASATGHVRSAEHRASLSAAMTGKKLSSETIAKRTATRRANAKLG